MNTELKPCLCPQCGAKLHKVRQSPLSTLNEEQFDSIKAGDWFCEKCRMPGHPDRFMYFWDEDLQNTRTRSKAEEAEVALSAWHKQFGTTQLTHAVARLERVEKERDTLRAELEKAEERVRFLAGRCGIEKCEPNAGDDPYREYWWNGFDTFASMNEAIDSLKGTNEHRP